MAFDVQGFISEAQQKGYSTEQIRQFLLQKGIGKANPALDNVQPVKQGTANYILPAIGEGIGNYIHNVKEDFSSRGQKIINSNVDSGSGKQNVLSGGLQTAGEVAGMVGDFFGEALKPSINQAADALSNNPTFSKIANSEIAGVPQGIINKYQQWSQQHPEAAHNLGSIFNIVSLLGAKEPIQQGTEAVAGGLSNIRSSIPTFKRPQFGSIVDSLSSENSLGGKMSATLSDRLTNISGQAETALKETPMELFNHYKNLGEQAMLDARNINPMQYAGQVASRTLKLIQTKLESIGAQKGKILDAIGHNIMDGAGTKAREGLWSKLQSRLGIQLSKDGSIINIKGRLPSISNTKDLNLIRQIDSKLGQLGRNPTMREVDDAIDFIQGKLYDGKTVGQIPINGKLEGALKEVSGQLNAQLRKEGGSIYAKANDAYARLRQIRDEASLSLGDKGNKGAALMKKVFSPDSTATQKLFTDIKKITGIDLTNHAVIAKFIMENVGDSKQASLLERVLTGQVSPSKTGVVNHLIDKGIGKFQDPFGKAKRIINDAQKAKPKRLGL